MHGIGQVIAGVRPVFVRPVVDGIPDGDGTAVVGQGVLVVVDLEIGQARRMLGQGSQAVDDGPAGCVVNYAVEHRAGTGPVTLTVVGQRPPEGFVTFTFTHLGNTLGQRDGLGFIRVNHVKRGLRGARGTN